MITTRKTHFNNLKNVFTSLEAIQQHSNACETLKEAGLLPYLGMWRQLYEIPFHYLVPDIRMLPMESIRFFYLDTNWVDSLIDGAFSLGRATTVDAHIDKAHHETVLGHSHAKAVRFRAGLLGLVQDEVPPEDPGKVTGFILRSQAVSGWEGIEVEAHAGGKELPVLRLDHLNKQTLIGFFIGEMDTLYIHPPAEGLHFGMSQGEHSGPPFAKTIRFTQKTTYNGQSYEAGKQPPENDDTSQDVAFRENTDGTVVDIYQLIHGKDDQEKDGLKNKLESIQKTTQFTAAEFAVQMVSGVDTIQFNVTKPGNNG